VEYLGRRNSKRSLRHKYYEHHEGNCWYFAGVCDRMGYQTGELSGMMRNPEQTIGSLIDKQQIAFIASVDKKVLKFTAQSGRYYSNFKSECFPVMKG
jgi:uncharacterized protein (DUF608 family)